MMMNDRFFLQSILLLNKDDDEFRLINSLKKLHIPIKFKKFKIQVSYSAAVFFLQFMGCILYYTFPVNIMDNNCCFILLWNKDD